MKIMTPRWFALAGVLLALAASSVHAQGPGGGGPGGGGMGRPPGGGPGGEDTMAVLMKALNLTSAQKTQVQPIADAATTQTRAIREEAMAKSDDVVKSAEAQIKPLLTPYQQQVMASLDKNREAMKKQGGSGFGGGGPGGPR